MFHRPIYTYNKAAVILDITVYISQTYATLFPRYNSLYIASSSYVQIFSFIFCDETLIIVIKFK
jgi:hypothetical protein